MTMLPNIEEAMEDARNGKLSPYWQNDLKRECLHGELSAEERLALSELNRILAETPQWSGEEELCIEMRTSVAGFASVTFGMSTTPWCS